MFNKDVLDPEKYTIISGDWNSARTKMDHLNYKDWEHYKPGTRKAINDRIIEHDLCDPYRQLNLVEEASASQHGWTWSSKQYGIKSIWFGVWRIMVWFNEFPFGSQRLDVIQQARMIRKNAFI